MSNSISKSKFDQIYHDLNYRLQRVYDATPKGRSFIADDVVKPLQETGVFLEHRQILGSLGALVTEGLLTQERRGKFERAEIRDTIDTGWHFAEPVRTEIQEESPAPIPATAMAAAFPEIARRLIPMEVEPEAVCAAPLESARPPSLLEDLAQRAAALSEQLSQLAVDLQRATAEVQHDNAANDEALVKLQRLQQVMAELDLVA
jgi:hypothetical protein